MSFDLLLSEDLARVNITWARQNSDLPDPVSRNLSSDEVLRIATEVIRGGDIPEMHDPSADLSDQVAELHAPIESRPYYLFTVRPKVPFGK